MTTEPPKRRRWFQFSLRTFLIAVVVLSLPLCWFAARLERARRQNEAVVAILALGGLACHEWESHGAKMSEPEPTWLRRLLGEDFFYPIVLAALPTNATDDDLRHLKALRGIESISLNETQITDAGLEQLGGLSGLRWLRLDHTQITDDGLRHLKKLASLEFLYLNATHVTDAGLEHLKGLTNLEWLFLDTGQVTPEGVEKLQEALPNCEIEYRTSPGAVVSRQE